MKGVPTFRGSQIPSSLLSARSRVLLREPPKARAPTAHAVPAEVSTCTNRRRVNVFTMAVPIKPCFIS